MSENNGNVDWCLQDSIVEESSRKKQGDSSFEETDGQNGIETEVLIKPEDIGNHSPLNRKCSPRKDAFIFSRLVSYFWMTKLFVKGSKQHLEHADLEGLMPEDCATPLTEILEKNWYEEAYDSNGKMKNEASLVKAIVKSYGFQYLLMGFFPAFSEVLRLIQPLFLGLLVDYFSGSGSSKPSAYGYAFGLTFCHFAISWSIIPYNYFKQMYGAQLRIGLTGLLYKKTLSLSHAALARATTGKIVNLVSNDVFRFEIMSIFLHYIWIAPIELIILTFLLVRELGTSAFAGIGTLVLFIPLQMVLGKCIGNFRQKIFKHSDQRVKSMNEIITGMKVIKLYTWEEPFKEIINEFRGKEVRALGFLMWARASIMAFFFSAGAFVSFITFMTYILAGNALTAKKVFTCVALFNVARLTFTVYLPIGITLIMETKVALKRIQSVLMEEEVNQHMHTNDLRPKPSLCKIAAKNISASWTEENDTLEGINFRVGTGELLAVIGPVGSGKSSLLMTLLGELPLSSGEVVKQGKVVYAAQEPWIFNGTIKYNITFGKEFHQERYNEVLEACALEKDISLMVDGDQTLVGERGVSLSGGQKARVNLARVIYADADIYIMDDPLSAVDANVGRHLYDKCINGYLSDKIRILVTHQMQYLSNADQIIALVDGRCVAQGSYYEISQSNVDFLNVLTAASEEEDKIDDAEELTSGEHIRRRFSRQLTCPSEENTLSPFLIRKRALSFSRQISHSSQCTFTESTTAVANDVSETVVYEELGEEVIKKETKQGGAIGSETYIRFFKSGYGKWVWLGTFLLMIICQVFLQLADWWLSFWTNNETQATLRHEDYEHRSRDLAVYATFTIFLVVLGLSRACLFFRVTLESSTSVHNEMFNSLMRAPTYFFDTNSIGRILNRFSKDTNLVDDMLAFSLFDTIQTAFVILGLLLLVTINLPIFLVIIVPIVVVFVMVRLYYIKTARELKRIEGVARSPLFGHFSTTLLGLPTIRSFRVQEKFFDIFAAVQDAHTEVYFSFVSAANWLTFNLDLLSGMLIIFCSFVCVIFSDSFQGQAGSVGLLLAYAINIPIILQNFIRQTTEVENYFTSVERLFEYCDIESEAPSRTKVVPAADWPKRGSITFDQLRFSYHRSLPFVLHSVTAKIHSKEKIGICGRTGAGKSSLLSTIFRTAEPNGKIFIDDQDILKLGLKDLRKKISIIPQEPVLFSGTLRKNLDPFKLYTDNELWEVLEDVQLKIAVQELPGKLDSEMAESGQNLSVGQRQLICLARAILRKNRILVVDEATANVDQQTDMLIQQTIRERFEDCTVLTIAHRLNTIIDSDRIMVLDAGVLKEFDEPYNLLRCKGSILYNLVSQTGNAEAQRLFKMSIESHVSRSKRQKEKLGCFGDCSGGCPCSSDKFCRVEQPTIDIVLDKVDDIDTTSKPHVHFSLLVDNRQPEIIEVDSKVNDEADGKFDEDVLKENVVDVDRDRKLKSSFNDPFSGEYIEKKNKGFSNNGAVTEDVPLDVVSNSKIGPSIKLSNSQALHVNEAINSSIDPSDELSNSEPVPLDEVINTMEVSSSKNVVQASNSEIVPAHEIKDEDE